MKRNDKQRLFEVMGRLDKTFKPKLNEGFEEELPGEVGAEAPIEEPKEKTPEEKLQELTAKVDELYALLHGEEEEEVPAEETGPEGLTEWNFDKKKGEKEKEKDEEGEKHEKKESPEFEKGEEEGEKEGKKEAKKELDETTPNAGKKIPVAAIAKVGK